MADIMIRKYKVRSNTLFWNVKLWTWEWKGRLVFVLCNWALCWMSVKMKFMGWNNILQIFVSIISSYRRMKYNFPHLQIENFLNLNHHSPGSNFYNIFLDILLSRFLPPIQSNFPHSSPNTSSVLNYLIFTTTQC